MRQVVTAAILAAYAVEVSAGFLDAPDLTPLANVRDAGGVPVEIVGADGTAKLSIVVEDRAEFAWAAKFLADTIAETAGARPKVVREKKGGQGRTEGPALFVGDTAASRAAGLSAPADSVEAFRVVSKNGSVYFLGRADYAVFDWCERVLGMRFYWPAKPSDMYGEKATNSVYGKCVEIRRGLSVPPVDYDDRPVYALRHNWPYNNTAWNRVSKGNASCRGMVNVHAPAKWYAEPDAKDHLEIFARNASGERATDPLLCYGNPATLEYYKMRIEDHIAGRRDSGGIVSKDKVVTVSQWDCDVYCTCEHCKRLMRPELGASGSGSPVIWSYFTTELAKWLKATHPDYLISILPYKNTCAVPEGLDLSPEGNVVAVLCTMPGLALLKDEACKRREEALIRRWAAATGNKVINWHYSCWPAEFTAAPYVFGETIARHYRDVKDVVAGTFVNGGYPANRLSLSAYVWMRCLWNPDVDVQAIYNGFASRMFGKAAAPMRRIVAMQEDGWNRKWGNLKTSMKNIYEISYPRDDVQEMRRLFAEAKTLAAGDEKALARIAWYESGFEKFFMESDDVANGSAFAPFMMKKAVSQPVVDGRLDDACWSVADGRTFVAALDRENPEPWAATELKAVWTARGITFGVKCMEPATGAMDFSVPTGRPVIGDNIELFLDCSGTNGGDYRHLIIDKYARKTTFPNATKWNTDDVKIAVHKGDGFWSVEVYVPYSCLKDFPCAKFPTTAANGTVWTGNVTRWRVGDTKKPKDCRVPGSKAELSRLNTRFNKWNRDPAAFSNFVFVE